MKELTLDGRRVLIESRGKGGAALYHAISHEEDGEEENLVQRILKLTRLRDWTLIAFLTPDWDRELSPWEASDGERCFAGEGGKTLSWLVKNAPEIEREYGCTARGIGGYSLSGLFALWAFYESGIFGGAASCSGSLWFPDWDKYAETHRAESPSAVYLSLGVKEEKTKNALMSSVGDRTRRQAELLALDPLVKERELVWHGGGHFTQPDVRTAQGFAWLAEKLTAL